MADKSKSGYGNANAVKHSTLVLRLELDVTMKLLEAFDTPRSLAVALLLKYKEYDQYLDLSINPEHYFDWPSFMDDYQATVILQKNPRLPSSYDKRQRAIDKFYDAEVMCKGTNIRLDRVMTGVDQPPPDIVPVLLRAQAIIERILGPHPTRKDLDKVENSMRFGPGATTSISGIVTQGRKYNNAILDCTENLASFRAFCFPYQWGQFVTGLRVVSGSRLTTVPKNAKVDRCICIEPDLNIYVQLGIGAVLRDKLRIFGLDLNSQEGNQILASEAWTKNLATIDLSSASDTLAIATVQLLIPPMWLELLRYPRCPTTEVDGNVVYLEKWSSMGNGYTFELESLIFYALALACTERKDHKDVRAYGDDIIVPLEVSPLLISALEFLGFKVNSEKTFGKGVFHESCGTDWFMGRNVRPFFLRATNEDFPTICYLYANNARRWAHRRNGGGSCDARCLPLWLRCFTAVRPKERHLIPEGCGDVGFLTDFDRAAPSIRRPGRGWEGYLFVYRRIGSVEMVVSMEGCLTAFLSGKRSDFSRGREALRGRPRSAKRGIMMATSWPSQGPWL